MNRPTRGQWRGYALLCSLLAIALLLLILMPRNRVVPQANDHSKLKEAILQYGEGMQSKAQSEKASKYQYTDNYSSRYTKSEATGYSYNRTEPTKRPGTIIVELNSADTNQLKQIRGIGSVFASRIVKYRALLGGYVSKEQLHEVYGMTEERYEEIAPYITIDTSQVERLHINEATLQQLKRHPYLDYYQAKAITEYRKKAGSIGNPQDLLKINLIDENTAKKIRPYIQFN